MAEDKTRPCPSCDGVMRRGVKDETVTYRGQSLTYRQPGWHCESCDDGILDGSDNAYADAALHEVMARAKGSPISPLMIRAAREAVGVSQRRAGKIFGGGPTAFYKYETAKSVPSEGMARLLRLALERPELFTEPAPGTAGWPSAKDAQLLRRAITDDRLGSILRRVYPQTDTVQTDTGEEKAYGQAEGGGEAAPPGGVRNRQGGPQPHSAGRKARMMRENGMPGAMTGRVKARRGLPVTPHGAPAAVTGDGAMAGRISRCHLPSGGTVASPAARSTTGARSARMADDGDGGRRSHLSSLSRALGTVRSGTHRP